MWFWGRNKRFNFYQTPTFGFFVNIILNYISIIDNNYLYVNKFEVFYRLYLIAKVNSSFALKLEFSCASKFYLSSI